MARRLYYTEGNSHPSDSKLILYKVINFDLLNEFLIQKYRVVLFPWFHFQRTVQSFISDKKTMIILFSPSFLRKTMIALFTPSFLRKNYDCSKLVTGLGLCSGAYIIHLQWRMSRKRSYMSWKNVLRISMISQWQCKVKQRVLSASHNKLKSVDTFEAIFPLR